MNTEHTIDLQKPEEMRKNPFARLVRLLEKKQKKINPIHEIVNLYYQIKKIDREPKEFYVGRYGYPKLSKEAKRLYIACGEKLEDAMWSLDKMNYKAEKGDFDWSISTCLKHNLL